ncbi:cytochrome b/b6 domain-containing protein [Heliophilum fasciatum]|uniref:Formate dehydrogenase gamma subunit n=1 Tax=Heliophilum fasciatum TaxID=35700 RepID=A0A4V2SW39_9FIRM|nr:cytochrome b/b6 domain-containing protein [Heliophilum fasciatum]MCW2279187.1 formate dehydrogenase gamma subunit [Heliophilum fasciatum]TCP60976.1 formate dehydrogenase gamma subunit [Heliophilum fasciatum]
MTSISTPPRTSPNDQPETGAKLLRHSLPVRLVHWSVAISTFFLFFTGFGQMPIYKRYNVTELISWSGDYNLTLAMHYAGAVVLLAAAAFHVVYHMIRSEYSILPKKGDVGESMQIIAAMFTGKAEPPSFKYLAEQRLAYAFIAANILGLCVSGLIKVYKNMPGVDMSESMLLVVTTIHNITAILLLLGIIAHLAAFLIPANRTLLPSMFTGLVPVDYVRHRHSKWWTQLSKTKSS